MKTVLISGLGVAGPTLAFWLRTAGFQPTLIEQAPAPRSGGYVIDFWGLGYDIAERMGLRDELDRIGYHISEMRIVNERGKRVAGFGTSVFLELTAGRYVTIARSALSRLLVEKIGDGAEMIFGDEIQSLRECEDCVEVELVQQGKRRFDLVVGADGLHSKVRGLVFGPQDRFERRLGYMVAAFETTGYRPRDDDVYVMFGDPGRMVGRVTLRDDRTLFLFVFDVGAAELLNLSDFSKRKAILHARFGDNAWECPRILEALDQADDLYFDRVSQIKMPKWSQGRIALVGDAAYCVSLMAGQGSALAMTGAYVLAGELAKSSGRHVEAFANYEKVLRPFIEAKQRGAERFAGAFAPKSRWGLFLRNQLINATAIPGFARIAFGRSVVDSLQLPAYSWK
ncbi:MAG TPA: FAD-binding domain [Xanthobacteraceae bacterium]|nr:FAD-binding domain [Xanthobacteraceae bacterium]